MKVTIKDIVFSIVRLFVIIFVVSCIIYPFSHGVPFIGAPKEKNIAEVKIVNERLDAEKIITEADGIDYARKLVNFVNYKIGSGEESEEQGFVTVKYTEKDGTVTVFSADNTNLYRNGKKYELADPKTFVLVTEGLFFFGEAVEYEQ